MELIRDDTPFIMNAQTPKSKTSKNLNKDWRSLFDEIEYLINKKRVRRFILERKYNGIRINVIFKSQDSQLILKSKGGIECTNLELINQVRQQFLQLNNYNDIPDSMTFDGELVCYSYNQDVETSVLSTQLFNGNTHSTNYKLYLFDIPVYRDEEKYVLNLPLYQRKILLATCKFRLQSPFIDFVVPYPNSEHCIEIHRIEPMENDDRKMILSGLTLNQLYSQKKNEKDVIDFVEKNLDSEGIMIKDGYSMYENHPQSVTREIKQRYDRVVKFKPEQTRCFICFAYVKRSYFFPPNYLSPGNYRDSIPIFVNENEIVGNMSKETTYYDSSIKRNIFKFFERFKSSQSVLCTMMFDIHFGANLKFVRIKSCLDREPGNIRILSTAEIKELCSNKECIQAAYIGDFTKVEEILSRYYNEESLLLLHPMLLEQKQERQALEAKALKEEKQQILKKRIHEMNRIKIQEERARALEKQQERERKLEEREKNPKKIKETQTLETQRQASVDQLLSNIQQRQQKNNRIKQKKDFLDSLQEGEYKNDLETYWFPQFDDVMPSEEVLHSRKIGWQISLKKYVEDIKKKFDIEEDDLRKVGITIPLHPKLRPTFDKAFLNQAYLKVFPATAESERIHNHMLNRVSNIGARLLKWYID